MAYYNLLVFSIKVESEHSNLPLEIFATSLLSLEKAMIGWEVAELDQGLNVTIKYIIYGATLIGSVTSVEALPEFRAPSLTVFCPVFTTVLAKLKYPQLKY